jgi:hypothetical protein
MHGGLSKHTSALYLCVPTYLQGSTAFLSLRIKFGRMSLVITLIAVAYSHFDNVKAAILDIRQQHITSHDEQEVEQVYSIANCELQTKLNTCIRHHQKIKLYILRELPNILLQVP